MLGVGDCGEAIATAEACRTSVVEQLAQNPALGSFEVVGVMSQAFCPSLKKRSA